MYAYSLHEVHPLESFVTAGLKLQPDQDFITYVTEGPETLCVKHLNTTRSLDRYITQAIFFEIILSSMLITSMRILISTSHHISMPMDGTAHAKNISLTSNFFYPDPEVTSIQQCSCKNFCGSVYIFYACFMWGY